MKKENIMKLSIIILAILAVVFVVIIFLNKKDEPKLEVSEEFNSVAQQLAQNHFDFVRIFEYSVLDYDSKTGKVTDATYSNYAEFEESVKNTYATEYANNLLTGDDAVYYNKDGKLYVNIDNASHAGVYTGNGDIVITVNKYNETKATFEAKISAYVDDKKEDIDEVIYTMVAEKQEDNSWKLIEVRK